MRLEAAATVPDRADRLIEGMPNAFDPEAAGDLRAEIQFPISGEGEGSGPFPSPRAVVKSARERLYIQRSP